ncbi:hypothetical protein T484DRAFT_1937895 [Baffinella frigidus]|nr:hypothetical protein T484DRAFT_1937895 [Cryptophyta sp. CCMP2293]|mmetsp:Transcript_56959/g.135273  ORF Transcript_56959/g.135273 Transcript_56959/m.135273 type:complete len:293 (-) Transcript_56959:85-963(-)
MANYGAIPLGMANRRGVWRSAGGTALVLSALAVSLTVYHTSTSRSELFGCGALGDCGPAVDFDAKYWSPVDGGRAVRMDFTHDINSVANFHTDDKWVTGAHLAFPTTETMPRVDVVVPEMEEPSDPMEYWTKVFGEPKPGYSKALFAGEDPGEEEEEEAADEEAEETPADEEEEVVTSPEHAAMVFGDTARGERHGAGAAHNAPVGWKGGLADFSKQDSGKDWMGFSPKQPGNTRTWGNNKGDNVPFAGWKREKYHTQQKIAGTAKKPWEKAKKKPYVFPTPAWKKFSWAKK